MKYSRAYTSPKGDLIILYRGFFYKIGIDSLDPIGPAIRQFVLFSCWEISNKPSEYYGFPQGNIEIPDSYKICELDVENPHSIKWSKNANKLISRLRG